jgi:hypothetical protein
MSAQFDLFADLPPPAAPAVREPTEDEITAAIEQTRDDDGLDLPRDYVRDMLAGRDPTDPAERTCAHTCGECVSFKPTKFRRHVGVGFFCAESYDDARRDAPACDTNFKLRVGPCEDCGPVCEGWPCANADPKEAV